MALDSVFIPEVRGRNVGDIRDKELRSLRNDVGHLFDESDKTLRLWIDDAEQVNRVHRWLPPSRRASHDFYSKTNSRTSTSLASRMMERTSARKPTGKQRRTE